MGKQSIYRNDYLKSVGDKLVSLGYLQSRKGNEWSLHTDSGEKCWIHVNTGLSIINPSLGVRYIDLQSLLPNSAGSVIGSMVMLNKLLPSPVTYTLEEGSKSMMDDLFQYGIPYFQRLLDRSYVIDSLLSDKVSEWPTISYSERIRLLPVLLADQGRISEACSRLKYFINESVERDQMVPGYMYFAEAFKEKFGCK